MKFGFALSNNQGIEDVQAVLGLAPRAEELGFESVWVSEHIFNTSYVYDRIGNKPFYEPLTILSYVAATTKRVALGTTVLVLPYHNPIMLAKVAATLDAMSGGRLILGIGVGVIEEELETMGSPFAERGPITDEAIAIMKELGIQEAPSFHGKHHSFPGMKFSPKPKQKPHIPLSIGGLNRPALRRAAKSGNGWHSSASSPEDLGGAMRYLRQQVEAVGRDPSEVPVSISLPLGEGRQGWKFLGTNPEEVRQSAKAYEGMGVDRIVITPDTRNADEMLPALEMLGRDVLPAFR